MDEALGGGEMGGEEKSAARGALRMLRLDDSQERAEGRSIVNVVVSVVV